MPIIKSQFRPGWWLRGAHVQTLRLRQREIQAVFRIGGSRSTIAKLLAAEIAIILLVSGLLCAVAMAVVNHYSNGLVRSLFIG